MLPVHRQEFEGSLTPPPHPDSFGEESALTLVRARLYSNVTGAALQATAFAVQGSVIVAQVCAVTQPNGCPWGPTDTG